MLQLKEPEKNLCTATKTQGSQISKYKYFKKRCSEKGPAWKAQGRVRLRETGAFPSDRCGG